jgi:hypothetical protein
MVNLFNREEMGTFLRHGDVQTFNIIAPEPSRRLRRSVALINQYAARSEPRVVTYEDRPVTRAYRLTRVAVMVAAALVALSLHWPLGWFLAVGLAIGLPVTVSLACERLLGETLVEFLASRLGGLPMRPMLYIKTAWTRVEVEHVINGQTVNLHPDLVFRD